MAYSDEFIRQIGKRASRDVLNTLTVRNLFFNFLGDVPEDLRWDIFNLFFPEGADDAELSTSEAERLSSIIDLVEGEYEEDELKLTNDELKYISEGVNDFALDLSDDILMNVMQAAVARGLMG
ncbi:MAG TPA: hypothetical protein DCO79_07090 [Spirochaeta sp.]|nr:hypothetical protein [Spirochaeta sp.]